MKTRLNKKSERKEDKMKIRIGKTLVAILACAGLLFFANSVKADELKDIVQAFIEQGIPVAVIDDLFSNDLPDDTLGARVDAAYEAGTINDKQYDVLYNRFMSLPDETRGGLKNAYSKGYAEEVINRGITAAHERLHPGSVRDHIKDLREQGLSRDKIKDKLIAEGYEPSHVRDILAEDDSVREHARDRAHQLKQEGYSREEIIEKLRNEGVPVDHLKDLRFGPAGSRVEHAKDIRAMDTQEAQHKIDRAHEKKQDRRGPSRKKHAKDIRAMDTQEAQHKVDRAHEKKQDIKAKPSRPRHIKDRGVRDRGAGRGREGVGRRGVKRRR
ncbi:MAG: hypothetical protein ISS45_02450 [Candidatus Omnitrophica bacterium]|nr:hypothetical protein [Candidatus Omnitrophota bacterium]